MLLGQITLRVTLIVYDITLHSGVVRVIQGLNVREEDVSKL